jgi:hypothetical protein
MKSALARATRESLSSATRLKAKKEPKAMQAGEQAKA